MRALEEEMEDLLSCFKKDRQCVVTQMKDVVLPSTDCKPIEIPKVKINPSIVALSVEDVALMVDSKVQLIYCKNKWMVVLIAD
jgi:hypothetical protein